MSEQVRRFYIMPSSVPVLLSCDPAYTPMTNHLTDVHTVPLVLATDYDALHAEAEALKREQVAWRKFTELADQTVSKAEAEIEALRAENAALRESSQDVRSLVEALEECAASLAWNCLGECRAIHAGPIMPAAMALDTARAALSAQQSAQPEFCCKHSYKVAKQAAWDARDLTHCKCDHNEYCEHCWPDDFREGGKWHGGFETKQSAQDDEYPPCDYPAIKRCITTESMP